MKSKVRCMTQGKCEFIQMRRQGGPLCGEDAPWSTLSWVWDSVLADIHWHNQRHAVAAVHLQKMISSPKIPLLDVARGKLQLCMCDMLRGKSGAEETEKSARALLEEILAAGGGGHMRWFAGDKVVVDANVNAPDYHACSWGEVGLLCVVMLMQVAQLTPAHVLVLSQVSLLGVVSVW
jgi:hypothetical protein